MGFQIWVLLVFLVAFMGLPLVQAETKRDYILFPLIGLACLVVLLSFSFGLIFLLSISR